MRAEDLEQPDANFAGRVEAIHEFGGSWMCPMEYA